MKWFLLVLFIGCGVNALGLTNGSDVDGLEDGDDFYSNVTAAEKSEMTKEERVKWGIGALVFLILFLVFAL